MKLTIKQQRFADEYIICANATEAAIKAGYSKKTATQMGAENLIKPYIKSYIDEKLAEIQTEKTADAQEVMEYLSSVMRGESSAEVVVVTGDGLGFSSAEHIQKAPDEKERLKAAELLGKRYRLFTESVNIDGGLQINFTGENELEE